MNTFLRGIIMRLLSHPAQRSPEFVAENGTADYGEEYVCISPALRTSATSCCFSLWKNPQLYF